MKRRVLFVCTHNSARSQIAEGLLRHLGGERFEAFSAGTEASSVHPLAIRAMAEIGMDISGQTSKSVDEFLGQDLDFVITVCDEANESCPVFPGGASRLHWSFQDPAAAQGTGAERLEAFRQARDRIASRIQEFIAEQACEEG